MTQIVNITNSGAVVLNDGIVLSNDYDSDIMDFSSMVIGSVQFIWDGIADASNAEIALWISNVRNESKFTLMPGSLQRIQEAIDSGVSSHMYLMHAGIISFRYCQLRYTAAGVTAGQASIVAVGKKGGSVL